MPDIRLFLRQFQRSSAPKVLLFTDDWFKKMSVAIVSFTDLNALRSFSLMCTIAGAVEVLILSNLIVK